MRQMQGVRIILLVFKSRTLGDDRKRQVGLGQKLPRPLDLVENDFLVNGAIQELAETSLQCTSG